ncbi:MAG: Ni/Fe hydrogenase subunit alpha [Thermofilum sp. ex4484_15]|nr:MAG: Ni/Fe hydrogenase subunit alpha [Thermofilum sp. ex4484_15]
MSKRLEVPYISRVEGKGTLEITIKGSEIEELKLRIFEAPRFIEAILVGRPYYEVHEITSRICGICPVTHQITALRAVEKAMGVKVPEHIRKLRKLLAIGGILSSHALHLFLLALPDYTGHPSVVEMAKAYPGVVKAGLRIKEAGDGLIELIGGRSVHPVSTVVGGFTSIPTQRKLESFKATLLKAKEEALKVSDFVLDLDFPDFERKCEHMALHKPNEYPVNEGRVVSTEGLDVSEDEYRKYVYEVQVGYSTAKHSLVKGRGSFMLGPLPRVNLNYGNLSDDAKEVASRSKFKFPCFNPFAANVARLLEIITLIDEAIAIIDGGELEGPSRVKVEPKEGEACALTEAPRGLNFHSYKFDERGFVTYASIAPPTCQHLRNIELDLMEYLKGYVHESEKEIARRSEMLVRAYDPCISCSAHFLEVKVKKG